MLDFFLAFWFFFPTFFQRNCIWRIVHSFKSICHPLPLSFSQFFSFVLRLISIDVISPNPWFLSGRSLPRCGGFFRFCNFFCFLSNFHYLYINRDLKHLKIVWTWMCFPSSACVAKWTFLLPREHELFYEDSDSYNER